MIDLEFVGDYRNPRPLTARQRELGFDTQSDGDFTFGDFLDIINPLQHIPVVSTLYREITGDEISPHARIIGDTLFGGPSGFVAAAANVFFEEVAGGDIGETVMALFNGEEDAAEPQFAGNEPPGSNDPLAVSSNGQGMAPDLVLPAGAPLTTAAGPAASRTGSAPSSHGEGPPPASAAASGLLTGQDALNALFHDLRRGPAAGPSMALPDGRAEALPLPQRASETMKAYPLPPRRASGTPPAPQPQPAAAAEPPAEREAAEHPLILAQDAPDAAIAGRMMEALDKYRAMSRQGQTPADPQAAGDEVQWRSDPASTDPWQFDPATAAGDS